MAPSSNSPTTASNPQEVQHLPEFENPARPADHDPHSTSSLATGLQSDDALTREILQALTKDELKDLMKARQGLTAKKNCMKDGECFVT
jgi:hypothetical protein